MIYKMTFPHPTRHRVNTAMPQTAFKRGMGISRVHY
jgi:hypothetical protein